MFGTVNSGAMFGEQEIVIKGEAKEYTCSGGSGLPVHYFFCSDCGVKYAENMMHSKALLLSH